MLLTIILLYNYTDCLISVLPASTPTPPPQLHYKIHEGSNRICFIHELLASVRSSTLLGTQYVSNEHIQKERMDESSFQLWDSVYLNTLEQSD